MPLYKNIANQKVVVFAWDTLLNEPKTGDAAFITAQISKDSGACAASNDTNPTELDAVNAAGVYIFDLTQAESNCDLFILYPKSSTINIELEPVVIYMVVSREILDRIIKAWNAGNWRLKSGTTKTGELLDADDKSTVILEMTMSKTTPFRTITVKI